MNDMAQLGRYYSERDQRFMQSINMEFLNNIVQTFVKFFRVDPSRTVTNIYGEASNGKVYEPGVLISSLIIHPEETTTKQEGPGGDRSKLGMKFALNENICKRILYYPVQGDLVEWDRSFFEVDNVSQEQHLGGQYDKSWCILCGAHLTKLSRLNIVNRARKST